MKKLGIECVAKSSVKHFDTIAVKVADGARIRVHGGVPTVVAEAATVEDDDRLQWMRVRCLTFIAAGAVLGMVGQRFSPGTPAEFREGSSAIFRFGRLRLRRFQPMDTSKPWPSTTLIFGVSTTGQLRVVYRPWNSSTSVTGSVRLD